MAEQPSLLDDLNERDRAKGMTRQDRLRRARRLGTLAALPVAGATALLVAGANSHPSDSESPKPATTTTVPYEQNQERAREIAVQEAASAAEPVVVAVERGHQQITIPLSQLKPEESREHSAQ